MNERQERDADGLVGMKCLGILSGVSYPRLKRVETMLYSPHQCTTWTSNVLSAANWTNQGALRGVAGIHACWPWTLNELLKYRFDAVHVLVELRGFGDTIQGDWGWRAEHAMIKKVWCNPYYTKALKERYEADFQDLDVWLTDFILTRIVDVLEERERDLYVFVRTHLPMIRPAFLEQIGRSYCGPGRSTVRRAAMEFYHKRKNPLCELEL
jgi:hypothetical protein